MFLNELSAGNQFLKNAERGTLRFRWPLRGRRDEGNIVSPSCNAKKKAFIDVTTMSCLATSIVTYRYRKRNKYK